MENNFKTVNKHTEVEIIEKKSRFIANVFPINSEKEALELINKIKKTHYNARHNCFAYVINEKIPIIRFSDDGEPSGTGGKPILDLILNENIKNILVVVTRYFGGILLGTGGLIRAYGKSAKEGILKAEIIEIGLYSTIYLTVEYSILGKVEYNIQKAGYVIFDTEYSDFVKFTVYVDFLEKENFINEITEITNNTCNFQVGENIMLKANKKIR